MANAEVSVPVGDVVVVPTEGNDGENPEDTKTQVILQLQPVQQGNIHKVQAGYNASTIEANEDMEIAYPITCGESKAILLWKKFVCPGINVKCVKFNDQLISPKHFVHLAGKSTLKDWKRAIRLGGIMLRKMMDSGQIDFYQHDKVCSNTCRSTKFDLLISSARAPVPGQQTSVVQTPTAADAFCQLVYMEEVFSSAPAGFLSELAAQVSGVFHNRVLLYGGKTRTRFHVSLHLLYLSSVPKIPLLPTGCFYFFSSIDLERQLEDQKKQAQDPRLKSQTVQNVVLMPVSTPKPPKRPRLQRPASTTVLSPSPPAQQPQFTVISPITITPVGQSFSMGNIPVATLSQGSSPVTVHTLPSGPQLFRYATVVSSAKSSSPDTVTIHPSSSLALLSSTTMQDGSTLGNMATMVSPVELVAMESGLTSAIQAVESTSEDGQTIIEIDPAPDPEAEDTEGKAVILETELRTEEKVVAEMEEHQHQVHNVEIVVLED
uniref:Glucocorticoid modulatory element binding protein 1 n=1 Tax=Jaculus jaculus TaxID=51337 RepID=A0A8C5JYD3_JACJA